MSGEENQRRLRVNPTLCTGFGYCAEIVPELISLDDWGYPIVDQSPIDTDGLNQHAKRAVAACPRLALLLEEMTRAAR
jgi:ferredoxin